MLQLVPFSPSNLHSPTSHKIDYIRRQGSLYGSLEQLQGSAVLWEWHWAANVDKSAALESRRTNVQIREDLKYLFSLASVK